MTDTAKLAALQSRYDSMVRAERASGVARVEEAKARLAGLLQIQANLEIQIREARQARDNAERDAKE